MNWRCELDMKAEEAHKLIDDWLKENGEKTDEGWICKRCGSQLMGKGERVPIHEDYSRFGTHAGMGETKEMIVPYCPKCDKQPTICIDCLDY